MYYKHFSFDLLSRTIHCILYSLSNIIYRILLGKYQLLFVSSSRIVHCKLFLTFMLFTSLLLSFRYIYVAVILPSKHPYPLPKCNGTKFVLGEHDIDMPCLLSGPKC